LDNNKIITYSWEVPFSTLDFYVDFIVLLIPVVDSMVRLDRNVKENSHYLLKII